MKKMENARQQHICTKVEPTSNYKLESKHEILDADGKQSAAEERLGRMF